VVAAGDQVTIAAGFYDEMVTVAKSGSASAPITFTGSTAAVITGFRINGNYITVSGLGLGAADTDQVAADLEGTGDVVTGCVINLRGSEASAVTVDGTNDLVANCNITGCTMTTSIPIGGQNCVISSNVLHDMHDVDVFHVWGNGNDIKGNEVYGNDNPNIGVFHSDFIQTWGFAGAVSTNIILENNYVHDCQTQLANTSNDGYSTLHNWTIRNNIFYNILSTFFSGIPNTFFYNNLFYRTAQNQGNPIIFYAIGGYSSTGAQVVNNIFLECGDAPQNAWVGAIGSDGGDLNSYLIDHNYFAGTNYSPKSASAGAFVGTKAILGGNPNFVSLPSNFRLQAGSILVDKGVAISSFTVDKDGVSRPKGAGWDVGPYER
jgi:hypothetical protein